MIISDMFSGTIVLVKNNMEMIITNIILGINDEIVSPYNEEISNCFRLGLMLSRVNLRISIAAIKPTVKTQKSKWIAVLKRGEVIRVVIDCSQ